MQKIKIPLIGSNTLFSFHVLVRGIFNILSRIQDFWSLNFQSVRPIVSALYVRAYTFVFLKIRTSEFSNFLHETYSLKSIKSNVFGFLRKIQNLTISANVWSKMANFGPKWPIFAYFSKTVHYILVMLCIKLTDIIRKSNQLVIIVQKHQFSKFWSFQGSNLCPKQPIFQFQAPKYFNFW